MKMESRKILMGKREYSTKEGVTLISLVITIVILIILSAVVIRLSLGEEGLTEQAQSATENYQIAEQGEMDRVSEIQEEMNSLGYGEGRRWPVLVGNDDITYVGDVPIPNGYTASQISTEDSETEGLVIYEIPEGATVNWTDGKDSNGKNQSTITIGGNTTNLQETVNQYVWIPVDINSMVMCESNTGASQCNLVYDEVADTLTCQTHPDTATNLVGRLYTSSQTGSNPYSYIMTFTKRDQTYTAGSGYHEPNTVSYDADNDLTIDQLKSDFTVMAKSVAKYEGFYISRYEVGANGGSKKNQQVLTADDVNGSNYLGANKWYGLYNTIKNSGANKQMIWGCQYDQVIKFVGEQAQVGHSDRNLTKDHALSGQNELDCMNNIYDLEGNYWEWTAEAYSTHSRAYRGSYCSFASGNSFIPASFRLSSYPTTSGEYTSSRSTLYL